MQQLRRIPPTLHASARSCAFSDQAFREGEVGILHSCCCCCFFVLGCYSALHKTRASRAEPARPWVPSGDVWHPKKFFTWSRKSHPCAAPCRSCSVFLDIMVLLSWTGLTSASQLAPPRTSHSLESFVKVDFQFWTNPFTAIQPDCSKGVQPIAPFRNLKPFLNKHSAQDPFS